MCTSAAPGSSRVLRARGVTLVEVIIATSVFAVILILALTEFRQSVDLVKQGAAEADLRRVAQRALDEICMDVRQTAATNGSNLTATASSISYARITGFNTVTQTADFYDTLISGQTYSRKWQIDPADATHLLGINTQIPTGYLLCGELDPTAFAGGGFLVQSSQPLAGGQANVPTLITLSLQLRRRVGLRGDGSIWYVTSKVSSTVLVRPG